MDHTHSLPKCENSSTWGATGSWEVTWALRLRRQMSLGWWGCHCELPRKHNHPKDKKTYFKLSRFGSRNQARTGSNWMPTLAFTYCMTLVPFLLPCSSIAICKHCSPYSPEVEPQNFCPLLQLLPSLQKPLPQLDTRLLWDLWGISMRNSFEEFLFFFQSCPFID